jgi:hypothetical protein
MAYFGLTRYGFFLVIEALIAGYWPGIGCPRAMW